MKSPEPEIVQRVLRYAGTTMRTARSPCITARETIELANWIAAQTAELKLFREGRGGTYSDIQSDGGMDPRHQGEVK